MKALIVLYDDITIVTETEVEYYDTSQLKGLTKIILRDEPLANYAEAYNNITHSIVISYKKLNNGKMVTTKKNEHPNWGGYRTGSGAKPLPVELVKSQSVTISITDEMAAALPDGGRQRTEYIRQAIREKLERSGIVLHSNEADDNATDKDQRYDKILKALPPTIKKYESRTVSNIQLTIIKLQDKSWQVGYGEYTEQDNAPYVKHESLLSALEWLQNWLSENKKKWIVK